MQPHLRSERRRLANPDDEAAAETVRAAEPAFCGTACEDSRAAAAGCAAIRPLRSHLAASPLEQTAGAKEREAVVVATGKSARPAFADQDGGVTLPELRGCPSTSRTPLPDSSGTADAIIR